MERLQQLGLSSRIKLLTLLMLLAVGLCLPAIGIAQQPKAFLQLELYLPYYHFGDGSPVKWWYSPSKKADARGSGIRCSFRFKRHSLSISSSKFGVGYYLKGPVNVGEIDSRAFKLRNLDYRFRFIDRQHLGAEAFAGISLRRGFEDIVIGYRNGWEVVSRVHTLRDWGARIGIRAEYRFWNDFHVSLETNYTYYFYRYDIGHPPTGFGRGSTIDQMALHLGLGYTIDKRYFTKAFWSKKEQ